MLKSTPIAAALLLTLVCSQPAFAQQDGGTEAGGGISDGLGGGSFTELDADEAFQNIERDTTIGATENTGAGFSLADEGGGQGGGQGGLGGLGGLGGGFGGLGGLGGFGNLFGGGATGPQTAKPLIRTRLRSAIDVAPLPAQQRQRNAAQRLRSMPSGSPLRGLNVAISGQTAVISGVVQDDRQRRMSELLLRLEPGIRNVDNQVIVAQ